MHRHWARNEHDEYIASMFYVLIVEQNIQIQALNVVFWVFLFNFGILSSPILYIRIKISLLEATHLRIRWFMCGFRYGIVIIITKIKETKTTTRNGQSFSLFLFDRHSEILNRFVILPCHYGIRNIFPTIITRQQIKRRRRRAVEKKICFLIEWFGFCCFQR